MCVCVCIVYIVYITRINKIIYKSYHNANHNAFIIMYCTSTNVLRTICVYYTLYSVCRYIHIYIYIYIYIVYGILSLSRIFNFP